MLFSTSVSMVSSGLIYCRPLIVICFRTRRTCPKVLDGKRDVFNNSGLKFAFSGDDGKDGIRKWLATYSWVWACESDCHRAICWICQKSLDLSKIGETKVL